MSLDARIVLIEDHAILRDGLRALLELEPDLRVVGHVAEVRHAGSVDEHIYVTPGGGERRPSQGAGSAKRNPSAAHAQLFYSLGASRHR